MKKRRHKVKVFSAQWLQEFDCIASPGMKKDLILKGLRSIERLSTTRRKNEDPRVAHSHFNRLIYIASVLYGDRDKYDGLIHGFLPLTQLMIHDAFCKKLFWGESDVIVQLSQRWVKKFARRVVGLNLSHGVSDYTPAPEELGEIFEEIMFYGGS